MKKQITAAMLAATMLLGTGAFAESAINNEDATVKTQNESKTDAVSVALELGIIENTDYDMNADITRLQFCEFAYNMLNSVKELPVAKLVRAPFDDVMSPKVNALAFVGIISGKGEYIFAPEDKITREEAAVILYRMAKYAELEIPMVNVDMSYSDNSDISEWAVSSVYSMKVLDVVTNSDGELFKPQDNYSVAESISSLVKLYNLIKK